MKLQRFIELLKQFDDDLEVEFCSTNGSHSDDELWFKPTTVETKFNMVVVNLKDEDEDDLDEVDDNEEDEDDDEDDKG